MDEAPVSLEESAPPAAAGRVRRVEVWPAPGEPDPAAAAVLDAARAALGAVADIRTARVYLIEAPLTDDELHRVATELLADPVSQSPMLGATLIAQGNAVVEVHYQSGVMDPVAHSTRDAILEMLPRLRDADEPVEVRTAFRYDLRGCPAADEALRRFAAATLANPVIQDVHLRPFWPAQFPHTRPYELHLRHVPLRDLDDAALSRLSRTAHLFLSLDEMRAIRDHYRQLQRDPTDAELETLAQTWSEHCVHKTLKSTVRYTGSLQDLDLIDRPGHTLEPDGSVTIANLLKSTVAAATRTLMERDDRIRHWCLSVFVDNAGVVRFDDDDAVCIKVETHNHPSAIEPYGGAATGIGGCIRDVMGTGLGARPVANTDVFCVAPPTVGYGVSGMGSRPHPSATASDFAPTPDPRPQTPDPLQGHGAGGSGLGAGQNHSATATPATFFPPDPRPQTPDPLQGHGAGGSGLGAGQNHSATATPATFFPPDPRPQTPDPIPAPLPKGVLHPQRILRQVVAGVRDYGNRMGIPTVNGAVVFHDDYLANPLVYCGCVGLIPIDKAHGAARPGDHIVALGGATGRDGIHGATFSSAELTDTHADEFAHAVQIGNAITQKKTLDAILAARDHANGTLFSAITDCGAGGFSSAVGEMGARIGATVHLDRAPLKYDGLSYTEVWISEAQERMVLAVPPTQLPTLRALCDGEGVGLCDLGTFGHANAAGEPQIELLFRGTTVATLDARFLHDGVPMPTRAATWQPTAAAFHPRATTATPPPLDLALRTLLAHPNLASKHWIIRQYDHEVQGGAVVRPLVGPRQDGPSDAAVIRPKLGSTRGVALGCGLCPQLSEKTPGGDSYWMALAALDEAVRNVVCVGADIDPDHGGVAILDNFCWPRCDDPAVFGTLVRAAEACYDGALAYLTPFVSGKDSLSNQFTTDDGRLITIPPTLLITALGIVPDATRCVTMDAKRAGNFLLIVGETTAHQGGSHLAACGMVTPDALPAIPRTSLTRGPAQARAVAAVIRRGLVASAHDCSDGGLLCAAAELAFAGGVGLDLDLTDLPAPDALTLPAACFAETPSRYLLEIPPHHLDAAARALRAAAVPFAQIGRFATHTQLTCRTARHGRVLDTPLDTLRAAWLGPLDW